jgi:hypothetical protein
MVNAATWSRARDPLWGYGRSCLPERAMGATIALLVFHRSAVPILVFGASA